MHAVVETYLGAPDRLLKAIVLVDRGDALHLADPVVVDVELVQDFSLALEQILGAHDGHLGVLDFLLQPVGSLLCGAA